MADSHKTRSTSSKRPVGTTNTTLNMNPDEKGNGVNRTVKEVRGDGRTQ